IFAVVIGLTRFVALGSIFAVLTLPAFYFLMTQPDTFQMPWFAYLLFLCVVAVLVVIKHRNNISRMLAGTESRIGERADTTDGASA
ncbi:MAG: glycerol-3-phosphate acyltransferase, partial [Planctomycetota bacterium]